MSIDRKKLTKLTDKELDYLLSKSAKVMPTNPSEQGWSGERVKRTLYEPLIVLFKWAKQHLDQNDTTVNDLYDHIESVLNDIANLEAKDLVLETDITTIANKVLIIENNVLALTNNLNANYVKKTSLTSMSSPTIRPVVSGENITFELKVDNAKNNGIIKIDSVAGIYLSIANLLNVIGASSKNDTDDKLANLGIVKELITDHNTDNNAHTFIRDLINSLENEIARLDGRGKSYGEIDKTMSELLAMGDYSSYITNYLTNAYDGYVNEVGNLVYTKVSDSETEHELEWNGSEWVDNGAWLVSKADNNQYGSIKGDGTYLSILNGIVQVLKSDYATHLGTSANNYTYTDLLNQFTQIINDIANRYTKPETIFEIERRLSDLLSMAGLQDTKIEYNGQDTFTYENQTAGVFPHTLLTDYNWVLMSVQEGATVEYTLMKPNEAIDGVKLELALMSKDEYASFELIDGDWHFIVYTKDGTKSNNSATLKMWGIKLSGITTDDIEHNGDNLKDFLDDLQISQTNQDIRLNEIEELARKQASGEVVDSISGIAPLVLPKTTATAPMNVKVDGEFYDIKNKVLNGDFANNTTTDWTMYDGTATATNGVLRLTTNGVTQYPGIRPRGTTGKYVNGDKVYYNLRFRAVNDINLYAIFVHVYNPTYSQKIVKNVGVWDSLSFIHTKTENQNNILFRLNYDQTTAESGGILELTQPIAINLTQTFGAGNEPTKEQMDLIVSQYPNAFLTDTEPARMVNFNKRIRSEIGYGDTLNDYQLVVNGNFLIPDSSNSNKPQGFVYYTADNVSLIGNVVKFTATAEYGRLQYTLSYDDGDIIYRYAKVKADSPLVSLSNNYVGAAHSGDGQWQILSFIQTDIRSVKVLSVRDNRKGDFTPVEVDYMGALNITQMKNDGWFSGWSNEQIKSFLDKQIQTPYTTSDLYLQSDEKGYSLPNGVCDTIEYRNGKYYVIKRIDETTMTALETPIETEIQAWGNLLGNKGGMITVDDIKIGADIYDTDGITTPTEISELSEITKIVDGVETTLDIKQAVISSDKLSFTHPDLSNDDMVFYAYVEKGDYLLPQVSVEHYIDNLVKTSPDGSVWKLDWSVSDDGTITWLPTKV